jgi:hypothetical protein
MKSEWIENPGLSFMTSVGAIAFQILAFFALASLAAAHRDWRALWMFAFTVLFFVPLVSVLGIYSSALRLKRRKGILVSSVGLFLNVAYLALFILLVIGSQSPRAWEF